MRRYERFLSAVARRQPDRVPLFDFLFQQPMYEALTGRRPESYNGPDAVRCALALDHDGVWLPFGGFSGYKPEVLGEGVYRDEWGTVYKKTASSWPIDAPIDYPIKSPDDVPGYRPPDPALPGRDAEIIAARAINRDGLALLGGVCGPFTTAWMLMGYETLCFALLENPSTLTHIFRMSNDFAKEAARLSVAAGCCGIWVSDDLGSSTGGFLSVPHFREYVLPALADLVAHIDKLGVPVLLHSCGCIRDYLPDLAKTKVAAIHPLQRTAGMDLAEVKRDYGGRFCIIGNIDSSRTLPYGSPEDVAAEVRAAIDIAAPGGGYVLASDHSLHDGIPVENIKAMFKTGAEYGRMIYANKENVR